MMAVLLTFLRLSNDNEIIALKAGGFSTYKFLPPVLLFCLVGSLLTGFMTIYGLPLSKNALKELMFEAAASSIDAGIKEGRFNDSFNGAMLYVNKVDMKNKELIDIFVEDRRVEGVVSTIIAPRGRVFNEPGRHVFHSNLFNGTINQVDLKNQTNHSINFDIYDIRLDMKQDAAAVKKGQKDDEEMSLVELNHFLRTRPEKDDIYFRALMKFHEKFSIPFACIALGLLAIPLGIQSRTEKRSLGIMLGLTLFLFYYLLLIQINRQKSLQDIIDESDYLNLRAIEDIEIQKINIQKHVIATGGSAVYSENAMRHLLNISTVVFLKVAFEKIKTRIHDFETRGITKPKSQTFHDLFKERQVLYHHYAEVTIDCKNYDQEEIAEIVASEFLKRT